MSHLFPHPTSHSRPADVASSPHAAPNAALHIARSPASPTRVHDANSAAPARAHAGDVSIGEGACDALLGTGLLDRDGNGEDECDGTGDGDGDGACGEGDGVGYTGALVGIGPKLGSPPQSRWQPSRHSCGAGG